ncbi:MAG: MlaD family protein [Deltaproteobacteria bacterium]
MATQRVKLLVGLFMTAGILIAMVATVWLGMNRYFEKGKFYATYFDQSVQGLTVDSQVKYRGVTVGRVDQIAVAPDSKLIMVVMMIESNIGIEKEMVAQLKVVGITGSMFIELDRGSEEDFSYSPVLDFPSKYPIIPSKPSEISKLFQGIDEVVQQINDLDLKGISERAKNTLDNINTNVEEMKLGALSKELRTTLANFNQNFSPERWEKLVSGIETAVGSLNQTIVAAGNTFSHADATIGDVRGVIDNNKKALTDAIAGFNELTVSSTLLMQDLQQLSGQSGYELSEVSEQLRVLLQNLDGTTKTLNKALGQLEKNPSRLIFGSPPPPRQISP